MTFEKHGPRIRGDRGAWISFASNRGCYCSIMFSWAIGQHLKLTQKRSRVLVYVGERADYGMVMLASHEDGFNARPHRIGADDRVINWRLRVAKRRLGRPSHHSATRCKIVGLTTLKGRPCVAFMLPHWARED